LPIVRLPDVVTFESRDIYEKHVHSHVIVKGVPAVPLLLSAESCAKGIPLHDGPDYQYSICTGLFYTDGSTFNHTYLDFSPGTHGWERVECYYRRRLPIVKMQVDYFFEHKKGRVGYRNFRIDEAPRRPEPDRRVVLLGDSNVITSYLAPKDRVDAMLGAALAKTYPSLRVEVENAGRGGDAVKPFLETRRYERDLLTLGRIDVIFVCFGGNDRSRYDVKTFVAFQRRLLRRLREDFPGIRVVLETGVYVDYPRHFDRDRNREMKPYWDAVRSLADTADGVLDIWDVTRRETKRGNWDLRYRQTPMGKLILNRRFDRGHENDPSWFSNIHHTPNANRIIAEAECEYIVKHRLL